MLPFRASRAPSRPFFRGVTNTVTDEGGNWNFSFRKNLCTNSAPRGGENGRRARAPPPPSRGKLWVGGGGGRTGCIHTGGWCLFPVRAADFFSVCSLMCPSNTRGGKARKMINFFPIRETQAGKTRIFLPWPPSFRRVRLFGGRKKSVR